MHIIGTIFAIVSIFIISTSAVILVNYIIDSFNARYGELIVYLKTDDEGDIEGTAVKISIPTDINFDKTKRVILKIRDER